jgi:hypothetical protein
MGKRNRFATEFACAGVAEQLAARATALGLIDAATEPDARRVLSGVLRFLWSAQRMTHLERERATGQAGTLLTALEALSSEEVRADSAERTLRESIVTSAARLMAPSTGPATDRFARARARLRGEVSGPSVGALVNDIAAFIEASPAASTLRAHRAAWSHGLLLELAFQFSQNGSANQAAQVLAEHSALERRAEENLMAYLFEGFEESRNASLDPLLMWR